MWVVCSVFWVWSAGGSCDVSTGASEDVAGGGVGAASEDVTTGGGVETTGGTLCTGWLEEGGRDKEDELAAAAAEELAGLGNSPSGVGRRLGMAFKGMGRVSSPSKWWVRK